MTRTVTFSGEQIGLVAGCIAAAMPSLGPADYEAADLMLEMALAALTEPLSPEAAALIDARRIRS